MESAEHAEKVIKSAFQQVRAMKVATEDFGDACADAHEFLSDAEIARVIDNDYSRSTIQSLRQKSEERRKRV